MSKSALPSLVGDYYSNILLLDPQGNPLTTISRRRADWYLDKKLGEALGEGDGYSDRVKLNFEPKKRSSNAFLQSILPTQCVICGVKEQLTLHHVIPIAVKRFFPEEEKNHTRQWCVLLCEEHHLQAEKICRPLYEKSLQETVKEANKQFLDKNKTHRKFYYKLLTAVERHNQSIEEIQFELSPEERALFEDVIEKIKVDKQVIAQLHGKITEFRNSSKLKVKEAKKEWGARYIEQMGGIQTLKNLFKEAFLSLNPQFLPDGFLVDDQNL